MSDHHDLDEAARVVAHINAPDPNDEALPDGRAARIIAAAISEARLRERRICAAYALDRADQYETNSACWSGVADVAHGIARGEAATAEAHGEFDKALYARVDGFRGKAPVVRPTDGIDP